MRCHNGLRLPYGIRLHNERIRRSLLLPSTRVVLPTDAATAVRVSVTVVTARATNRIHLRSVGGSLRSIQLLVLLARAQSEPLCLQLTVSAALLQSGLRPRLQAKVTDAERLAARGQRPSLIDRY